VPVNKAAPSIPAGRRGKAPSAHRFQLNEPILVFAAGASVDITTARTAAEYCEYIQKPATSVAAMLLSLMLAPPRCCCRSSRAYEKAATAEVGRLHFVCTSGSDTTSIASDGDATDVEPESEAMAGTSTEKEWTEYSVTY